MCPRSSDPFHLVSYYIKWAPTSWTYSITLENYDDKTKGIDMAHIIIMNAQKYIFENNVILCTFMNFLWPTNFFSSSQYSIYNCVYKNLKRGV